MARFGLLLLLVSCSSTPTLYGPAYDAGGDGTVVDAAPGDAFVPDVVAQDTGSDASGCTSQLTVLAGSSTALYSASGPALSALTAASLTGSLYDCGDNFGCANPIAIARFGTGLLAVFGASNGLLLSATFATSWQTPSALGTASTIDGPSLAIISATAHLLYQGSDFKYYHGQYTAGAWDGANDPVGGSASQSYGARAPAGAPSGTSLVAVQAGSDSYLYAQTWSGFWATAQQQGSAAVQNTVPPSIIALSGGSSDLLAAYLRNGDYKIMALNHTSGAWNTTPALVDPNAFSNDPITLVPLPSGKALLVFRGTDMAPYWSMWDGMSTWTTAAPVLTSGNPSVGSVPSASIGVCGVDAFVAWADSGGNVSVVPFTAGSFGTPSSVSGATGSKFVAIGTVP
jgi:hypothetical protein